MSGNRINVVALRKIGRYSVGDIIPNLGKYEARVLVAVGKAKFEDDGDEFRRVAPKKRGRRTYARRDMVATD